MWGLLDAFKAMLCGPQFAVKMVTDDSDLTTDIVVEGDVEEIERFCKVCTPIRTSSLLYQQILQ